jgi:hypothetical protein
VLRFQFFHPKPANEPSPIKELMELQAYVLETTGKPISLSTAAKLMKQIKRQRESASDQSSGTA